MAIEHVLWPQNMSYGRRAWFMTIEVGFMALNLQTLFFDLKTLETMLVANIFPAKYKVSQNTFRRGVILSQPQSEI